VDVHQIDSGNFVVYFTPDNIFTAASFDSRAEVEKLKPGDNIKVMGKIARLCDIVIGLEDSSIIP